jgi:protocatechuate 3,4-dioxygenase beta subunit
MPSHIVRFFFSVFLLFSALSTTLAQQPANQPAKGNCTISGHVTIEGKDAANVTVVLKKGGTDIGPEWGKVVAKTKTDGEGNYKLENLPLGSFNLTPQMPAHVVTNVSSRRDFFGVIGKAVTLKDGDNIKDMNFTMTRGGVITGRVADSEGRPVIDQKILLWRVDEKGNKTPVQNNNYQMGITDDRGIYRYYGLSAGQYLVSVGSDPKTGRLNYGRKTFYPQTFYPNTQNKDEATTVEVTPGDEATGIDIRVGPRAYAYEVSGRVINQETNQPVPNVFINVTPVVEDDGQGSYSFGGFNTNEKGEFKFPGLTSGRYKLGLFFNDKTDLTTSGTMIEIKDDDVRDVVIKAKRGQSISGTITFENTSSQSPPVTLDQLNVGASVQSDDKTFSQGRASVAPDGSFVIGGLKKGKVYLYLNHWREKGLHILRVERGGIAQKDGVIELGQDESIQGIHLHIVYGACVLRGEVKAESGNMPADSIVSIQLRRVDGGMLDGRSSNSRADALNRFAVEGLPPGEYEIIASVSEKPNSEGRAKTLFTAKQKVTVSGNETQVIVKVDVNGGSQ